jgi:carbon storage regulator CsrA
MLVLSRKESESVIINENIIVTILRIAGGGVRIGIEAPREIPVRREELTALRTSTGLHDGGESAVEVVQSAGKIELQHVRYERDVSQSTRTVVASSAT